MYVLGIETSCDETGIAIYHKQRGLLSNQLYSQIEVHAPYGGVVPELASRDHVRKLGVLYRLALEEARIGASDLDVVAYTEGPGLVGPLLVGASFAKALAFALGRPALGIHHLEAHLLASFLEKGGPDFPFLALLVSGGHTLLAKVEQLGRYELLGQSLDDAAGEAFDKAAKLLGLSYPGGPALARLASSGRREAYAFARPLLHRKDYNFSFSGLKTQFLYAVEKLGGEAQLSFADKADLAASVEAAIVDVLCRKTQMAIQQTGLSTLVVAGGVAANERLRSALAFMSAGEGCRVVYPALQFCTDNAAMVAIAGALRFGVLKQHDTTWSIRPRPRWPLTQA